MDATEQATEQLTRIMLMGTEYSLRLSGAGAKNLSALLISAAKGAERTKGKIRLESLLKSGRPLSVFELNQQDIAQFSTEAKRYGILYTIIAKPKSAGEATVDVLVKHEDKVRVDRIFEKLYMGTIDNAAIAATVEDIKSGRAVDTTPLAPDKGVPSKDEAAALVDDLLKKSAQKERESENPMRAKTGRSPQSGHSSERDSRFAEVTEKEPPLSSTSQAKRKSSFKKDELSPGERSSVKAEIAEIKRERKEATKTPAATARETKHQQPPPRKTRATKGR